MKSNYQNIHNLMKLAPMADCNAGRPYKIQQYSNEAITADQCTFHLLKCDKKGKK